MVNAEYIKSYINQFRKPKVLFIWIPKNAGTSIYESLNESLNMRIFLKVEEANKKFTNKGLVTFGHINVRELLNRDIITEKYYNNAFTFCVSRNPFDRFVSLLHYLKKHERIPSNYKGTDLIKDVVEGIPVVGLYNFKGISQCNRQVDWIENIRVDKILRFENLYNDIHSLSNITGKEISMFHKNKSLKRKNYYSELDEYTIKMIKEYYEPDFKMFNYSMKFNSI